MLKTQTIYNIIIINYNIKVNHIIQEVDYEKI